MKTIFFGDFEWDLEKELLNIKKHGISFEQAAEAFLDLDRLIVKDGKHSAQEPRYFCIGKVGFEILTVRFLLRERRIRIIGAGSWRKESRFYEKEKKKRI